MSSFPLPPPSRDSREETRSYVTTDGCRCQGWSRKVRHRSLLSYNSVQSALCPKQQCEAGPWSWSPQEQGIAGRTLTSYPGAEGNGALYSTSPYPSSQVFSEKTILGCVPSPRIWGSFLLKEKEKKREKEEKKRKEKCRGVGHKAEMGHWQKALKR